jgi:stage II sporulation protein D
MDKTTRSRRARRVTGLALLCAALLALVPAPARAASVGGTLRAGLFYGSNALPTANLANEVGSGYNFGYFDAQRNFNAVGQTTTEKITICKDTNLYYSGGAYSDTRPSASFQLVGAYHLQTDDTYDTYEAAAAAAAGYNYGFPAYVGGAYRVRFEFYSSQETAAADQAHYPGTSVVGASASCYTVVRTGTNTILFEYDGGPGGNYFGVMPDITGASGVKTWFKGYCYAGGFQYARRSGADLTVVNFVGVDDYVQGVVPYEMNATWPVETLKAGAVAARTFAEATVKHTSYGFDVCNSTCCQVYRGVYSGSGASNITRAAQETAGQCLYYNGKLIEALYHSSDGGATEDAANAWGSDYPYLTGKEDPYELSVSIPTSDWSYSMSGTELAAAIRKWSSSYSSCSTIVSVAVTEYTPLGNANKVVFTDSNGKTYTFTKDNTRGVFQNYFPNSYFSRRFIIVAPGQTYSGTGTQPSGTGDFTVTDGKSTVQTGSVYAITASGTEQVTGAAASITGSGLVPADTGSGSASAASSADFATVTNTSSTNWLIVGKGYGHNVGMSQYGAYAMGQQGYSYDQILKFYYTGVTIG